MIVIDRIRGTISVFAPFVMALLILIALMVTTYNWAKKRRGNVEVPGVSIEVKEEVRGMEDEKVIVRRGDSLWKLSVEKVGDGYRWSELWKENGALISNPDVIFSGWVLTLPKSWLLGRDKI